MILPQLTKAQKLELYTNIKNSIAMQTLPQLTTAEKIEIYTTIKNSIPTSFFEARILQLFNIKTESNFISPYYLFEKGLCFHLQGAYKQLKNKHLYFREFSEFEKYKPKNIFYGGYWFKSDYERIKVLKSIIQELKNS